MNTKTGFAFSDEKTVVFFAHTHFGAMQITWHEREFAIQYIAISKRTNGDLQDVQLYQPPDYRNLSCIG